MSEIDRRWIVANVIAAVALAAAGFLDYVARDWLEAGGVKIAVLKSPQGHEIELIQMAG